jgi:hypothetical protein
MYPTIRQRVPRCDGRPSPIRIFTLSRRGDGTAGAVYDHRDESRATRMDTLKLQANWIAKV